MTPAAFATYNGCVAVASGADMKCIRNPNYQPPPVAQRKTAPDKAAVKQR